MLTVVVILNFLISLFCLYVSWRVWKLRRVLRQTTNVLTAAERSVYKVLHVAPPAISQGQLGVQGLRERYQQLQIQLQMVRQVLTILSMVQGLYRTTQGRKTVARRGTTKSYSSVASRAKRSH
ncbi:MAG: hypothetical protein WA919_21710 [Coleofasciculaceae cyanobacterium]